MPAEVETIRTVELPTRIVHGPGALARLGELATEFGMRRPLLVTDAGVLAAGLAVRALEQLEAAGLDVTVFDEVRPNPDVELIDRGAAVYRERGCDGLVAIGGGSPMDAAKSIGVVVEHGGSIASYEWGHDPIERRIPPLVAVPTTAGTGSEVTLWAVVTHPGRRIKFNVGGTPLIAAHVALIDPELMVALPPEVTAATGMDALAHAIECYTSDYHQPFNDAVALHAIELAARWLPAAVDDGRSIEARTAMAHAAALGGMAYGTESAGAAHAMSQSAGGVHDCSHGALTARLLAPVCEFNAPSAPERYARVAQALGVPTAGVHGTSGPEEASRAPDSAASDALETALAGVEALYRLTDRVGIPTMVELGFTEAEIPMLARIAFDDPQTIGNPRELGVAEYETIYRTAFAARPSERREKG